METSDVPPSADDHRAPPPFPEDIGPRVRDLGKLEEECESRLTNGPPVIDGAVYASGAEHGGGGVVAQGTGGAHGTGGDSGAGATNTTSFR